MSAHRRIDYTWYEIRSDRVEKRGTEHEGRSTKHHLRGRCTGEPTTSGARSAWTARITIDHRGVPPRSSQVTEQCQNATSAVDSQRHDLPASSGTTRTTSTAAAAVCQSPHWSKELRHGILRDADECVRSRSMADVRYGNHQQIMTTIPNSGSEATLYVCRDCGDGIEDPTDTSTCPHCSGTLVNSTVPHD